MDEGADTRLLEQTLFEVKRVIVGQDRLVERLLTALLAGGHCLLEGVPGVAKTLAAQTLADGGRRHVPPDPVHAGPGALRHRRHPDLPGVARRRFDVELGPVMANLVLADEINRAPAKVQSALLEVMAERQVSIGGRTLPGAASRSWCWPPRTRSSREGVYQLPEAQRDRFLMKVVVGYPTDARGAGHPLPDGHATGRPPRPVLDPRPAAWSCRPGPATVFVHHALAEYVVRLVLATRDPARFGAAGGGRAAGVRRQPARHARPGRRRPGRWRCCAAATTCCPRTSANWPSTCSRTGWCCPSTRSPTASPAETLVRRIVEAVPPPRIAPAAGDAGPGRRHERGRARSRRPTSARPSWRPSGGCGGWS